MRLVAFGVGYVGLVTGTGLSELGHEVLCVDIDATRVRELSDGVLPIYEPGLADLVRRNVRSARLSFAQAVTQPFDEADVYFIAVGTPQGDNGVPDLRAVFAAAEAIGKVAKRPAVVAIKSTVPVGTCARVEAILSSASVKLEVVSNPEFLKEGAAVQDFFRPDRIVFGARSEAAGQVLRDLYGPLQLSGERLVVTDPESSELIKYAANTMLAMRVSFMNELSRLCDATGADIHAVRHGLASDTRIGKRFLFAGPGYGGSCFPKDVLALAALGREHGVPMRLAEATHLANEEQSAFIVKLLEDACGGVEGKTIALWGLAFKPETDDVRESPAIKLTHALLERGASVVGHDPEATKTFERAMAGAPPGRVTTASREYDALDGAEALVLLTEWRSYRAPNFVEIQRRLCPTGRLPAVVLDARNIWRPSEVAKAGLRYKGVGVRVSGAGR